MPPLRHHSNSWSLSSSVSFTFFYLRNRQDNGHPKIGTVSSGLMEKDTYCFSFDKVSIMTNPFFFFFFLLLLIAVLSQNLRYSSVFKKVLLYLLPTNNLSDLSWPRALFIRQVKVNFIMIGVFSFSFSFSMSKISLYA